MSHKLRLLPLVLAVCSTAALAAPSKPLSEGHANRLLVQPRAGMATTEVNDIFKSVQGKARKLGQSDVHVIEFPNTVSAEAVLRKYERHPMLKYAELDKKVAPSLAVTDPYIGSQWHLAKVNAPAAWDVSQGQGVVIAILDSGVDPAHPDLVNNLVPGYNANDRSTNTRDICGHGTAVAGVAAAQTNNAIGVAGVAGHAKIMPVMIAHIDATTGGCMGYYSTIAAGLTFAADNGAKIANISYGGVSTSASIQSAAQYLRNKGGLTFISANNNGINETYAPVSMMIPVSATDSNDNLFSWSSYGSFVSLSAPGSTWTTKNGGTYSVWQGTSFASPLAAGVGALVMATNPLLGAADVESVLLSTAVDLGTVGRDIKFGHGRVDAFAAVSKAQTIVAIDKTAPEVTVTYPAAYSSVSGLVGVNVTATDIVGVDRIELSVNGSVVAIDTSSPYGLAWDSTSVPNGMATLVVRAIDAAGNVGEKSIPVNVANNVPAPIADIIAPVVGINNPLAGSVSGQVSVNTTASDNSGAAGIKQQLFIDGSLKASSTGSKLSYNWNTKKVKAGNHTLEVFARDAAGNIGRATTLVTVK